MNFLITGGTGFIGSKLCACLLEYQHNIVVLTRHPEKIKGNNIKGISQLEQLTAEISFDTVINLAGEPIADKRWSQQQKELIYNSRMNTTNELIKYFNKTRHKPELFISASAIGYYGISKTNTSVNEEATGDQSFSSQLCQQWEAVALQANALGIRTCLLRTGIVLGKDGGALKKMLPPFKLGLGGKIGDGYQWMSWIHLGDLVGIILYCIEHNKITGAVNGTSPNPVTNTLFTRALGKVLKRPTVAPLPTVVVRLLMGQMGKELLLAGKKVLPDKIIKAGYKFKYEQLEEALKNVV